MPKTPLTLDDIMFQANTKQFVQTPGLFNNAITIRKLTEAQVIEEISGSRKYMEHSDEKAAVVLSLMMTHIKDMNPPLLVPDENHNLLAILLEIPRKYTINCQLNIS